MTVSLELDYCLQATFYFPSRNDLLVPAVIQVVFFYVVVKLRKFPITCVAHSDRINGT